MSSKNSRKMTTNSVPSYFGLFVLSSETSAYVDIEQHKIKEIL